MNNLAYKERESIVQEEIEKIRRENVLGDRAKRKQKAMGKGAVVILAYTIIFSAAGMLYLSSIINKTKHNMKIEELKKQAASLQIEVHKLKADTDTVVNLYRIEGYARNNFGMEIADDIRYVKIK